MGQPLYRLPEVSGRWAGASPADKRAQIEAAHTEALAMNQPTRPSVDELAALSTNRRVPATRTKAHLAPLTDAQLRVLWAADNPSGCASQNGSTGITRPLIKALDAKGYGRAQYDMQRHYLIVGFEINDRGRKAARERFGTPKWAIDLPADQ